MWHNNTTDCERYHNRRDHGTVIGITANFHRIVCFAMQRNWTTTYLAAHAGNLNVINLKLIVLCCYSDVIMGKIASQIISLIIVYSTVYFGHRSKKTSKLRVTGLWVGNSPWTGEFPAQMARNAEDVSIWWRHHDEYAHSALFDTYKYCWYTAVKLLTFANIKLYVK